MDIEDIKKGDIVYPYGSPARLGQVVEIHETKFTNWVERSFLVEWVKPKPGTNGRTWEKSVKPLDGLIDDTEHKLATHRANKQRALDHFASARP